jgi:hypothetical protein
VIANAEGLLNVLDTSVDTDSCLEEPVEFFLCRLVVCV